MDTFSKDVLLLIQSAVDWFIASSMAVKVLIIVAIVNLVFSSMLLIYFSAKRRGIPYRKTLMPTPSGYEAALDLSAFEWLVYFLIFFVSAGLVSLAIWGGF